MTSSAESLFGEYTSLYLERDVEGVTDLCLWPFLAIRKGRTKDGQLRRDAWTSYHLPAAPNGWRFLSYTNHF